MAKPKNKTAGPVREEPAAELPPWARQTPDGMRIRVHVTPRASRTELAGTHGDALAVRLQAPPVDGKANAALCAFFAERFDLPKSKVRVVAGETSRDKTLELSGLTTLPEI